MTRQLARAWTVLGTLLLLFTLAAPPALADDLAKPPEPIPEELSHGQQVGIDKDTGAYCDLYNPKPGQSCRPPKPGELPGTADIGEFSKDPKEAHKYEVDRLKEWRKDADHNAENYKELNEFITKCVKEDKRTFTACFNEGRNKHPPPAEGPADWVAGKISQMAADALEEAAGAIGESVVWLLEKFAGVFTDAASINLSDTGIGPVMGIMTGLSALVATMLLLIQFGKLAISQDGTPLVTALTGLAKWGVVLAVYVIATQVALDWSHTLSTAMINESFDGGGSGEKDAAKAMEKQLGTLFSGLIASGGGAAAGSALITGQGVAASAVGAVIVLGILCILAIGALWIEMMLRQAGIMVLICVMPIVLAGQMADSTREWWPKARNALISLVLMEPVIVTCFSIGFNAMAYGKGIRNVIVGLIIFLLASFAWPALAKFMTFTTNGSGGSTASGLLSSLGSSASSKMGGYNPSLSGPGTAGGGSSYTKALEGDNAQAAGGGGTRGAAKGAGFGSKVGGSIGLGLQLAAVGKDTLESTAQNTAAHAGLDHAAQGGRHVVMTGPRPPRESGGGEEPDQGHGGSPPAAPPPPAPPASREPSEES